MIYVDDPVWGIGRIRFAHLISDTSFEELHEFAGGIGLARYRFHRDHYDLPAYMLTAATAAGARKAGATEVLALLRKAGLRRPPRRRRR